MKFAESTIVNSKCRFEGKHYSRHDITHNRRMSR